MKKRLIIGMGALSIFVVTCFSINIFASSNTKTYTYGGLYLTCYINCTNNYGEGSTNGADMDGYKNYIKVVTYDIDQNYIGESVNYNIDKASARVSKGFPYFTRTFHAATDTYNNQLLPLYQQIQMAQGR